MLLKSRLVAHNHLNVVAYIAGAQVLEDFGSSYIRNGPRGGLVHHRRDTCQLSAQCSQQVECLLKFRIMLASDNRYTEEKDLRTCHPLITCTIHMPLGTILTMCKYGLGALYILMIFVVCIT